MRGGPRVRDVVAATVACVVVAMGAGVARAATLPDGSTPLPGSSFEGGDGNQDDQAPYVDWQGFQAAGRVAHSPDPNAADSAFVGGSKEDEPGEWDLTTEAGGVSPAKSNILDAWSAVDQPAAGDQRGLRRCAGRDEHRGDNQPASGPLLARDHGRRRPLR